MKSEDIEEAKITQKWWRELNAARSKDTKTIPHFTTGDSAELRRAKSIDEVIINSSAFHDLKHRLAGTKWNRLPQLALVAGVLSHVKKQGATLPIGLNTLTKKESSSKDATKLRFKRLIQNETPEDLYRPMIRMVSYLEETANINHLANSLYFWNDKTRKDWAIEFYENLL